MSVIICRYNPRWGETPKIGDKITTTTSEFDYDNLCGCFDKEADESVPVKAKWIGEDYSEYVAEKSRNGGCYGYDFWEIIEILEEEDSQ